MRYIVMTAWYDKYTNIPYKHLGDDPETGIDCLNLCRYAYFMETGISIPHYSYHFCNIVDNDWYNKTSQPIFEDGIKTDSRWTKVLAPSKFDFIVMSIGSTNISNHCALYLGSNKILQTMLGRSSWITTYGRYYQQYTTGIYRWTLHN